MQSTLSERAILNIVFSGKSIGEIAQSGSDLIIVFWTYPEILRVMGLRVHDWCV
jgi:hypothetical protein